jgi:hypothetical protein
MPSLPRTRSLAVAAAAAVTLTLLWGNLAIRSPATTSWSGGDSRAPIEPAAQLPTEFPLRLELRLDEPMHVYVASHDLVRGTIAMFPSTTLRSDLRPNPLQAGTHVLPGTHLGKELAWHAGDGVGGTTFLVVASRAPLPEVASALRACRQMGNAAFPHLPVLGTYAPSTGMENTPARTHFAHPLLEDAAKAALQGHDGPMVAVEGHDGVFAAALRVITENPTPPSSLEQATEQIRERLGSALPFEAAPAPAGK